MTCVLPSGAAPVARAARGLRAVQRSGAVRGRAARAVCGAIRVVRSGGPARPAGPLRPAQRCTRPAGCPGGCGRRCDTTMNSGHNQLQLTPSRDPMAPLTPQLGLRRGARRARTPPVTAARRGPPPLHPARRIPPGADRAGSGPGPARRSGRRYTAPNGPTVPSAGRSRCHYRSCRHRSTQRWRQEPR
jgi:hypothetical protein